jgi:hypothetical protein
LILVWYDSAGDWNEAPQTPRDRMLTHESRIRECDRLKAIGMAGLKIDSSVAQRIRVGAVSFVHLRHSALRGNS